MKNEVSYQENIFNQKPISQRRATVKRFSKLVFLGLLLAFFLGGGSHVWAEKQRESNNSSLWQDFRSRYSKEWTARWNEVTSTPVSAIGPAINLNTTGKEELKEEDIEQITKEFIQREEVLGVRNFSDLKLVSSKLWGPAKQMWHVTYQQYYRDIKVEGAFLRFRLLPDGQLIKFGSDIHPKVYVKTQPLFTEKQIEEFLLSQFENPAFKDVRISLKPELLIYPKLKDGNYVYHLAYKVGLSVFAPAHSFLYYVDAQNLEVIEKKDLLKHLNIWGTVESDIYNSNLDAYNDNRSRYSSRNQKVFIGGFTGNVFTNNNGYYSISVPNNNPYSLRGEFIEGMYCNLYLMGGQSAWHDANVNGGTQHDWVWDGQPWDGQTRNRISEANAFHHINLFHDFVLTMNFAGMDYQLLTYVERPNYDNSYYDPLNDELYFGAGVNNYRNMALFPDVVYHEYMHAVTEKAMETYGSFVTEDINEALSDYFAASTTNDPLLGHYSMKDDKRPFVRNIQNELLLSEDAHFEVHEKSKILSGALWDLRQMLGKETVDRLAFQLVASWYNEALDFEEVFEDILLFDDGDGNIYNGTPHLREIYEAFIINHSIGGLAVEQVLTGYADGPEDSDNIIEATDGDIDFQITLMNDDDLYLAEVVVNSAALSAKGYTFDALEAQGSFGTIIPGEYETVHYRLHPRDMYLLPHDETFELELDINVRNNNFSISFDKPFKRKIRIPVGKVNAIPATFDNPGNKYWGQNFSYRNNKIVFPHHYISGTYPYYHRNFIYLYDFNQGSLQQVRLLESDYEQIDPNGTVSVDGKNIVWAERLNDSDPWDIYIYNLGANGVFGGGDDIGPTRITTDTTGGINPRIHGRYIAYIRNDKQVGVYDLGPDMIKNGNDPGQITLSGATFTDPKAVSVWDGKVVWSDTPPGQKSNIYFYYLGISQFATVVSSPAGNCFNPDVSDEWVVWEDFSLGPNPKIRGYHFGIGSFGDLDDMGYVFLSPTEPEDKGYYKPRLNGSNLLFFDDQKMRPVYMDLKTFKRMAASDLPDSWWFPSDIDGKKIAVVTMSPGYEINIRIEEAIYGDNKIATEVIPYGSTSGEVWVSGDMDWRSVNTPYLLLDDVFIGSGSTLTIGPGVQVRTYKPERKDRCLLGIMNGSSLVANGERENRILFMPHTDEDGITIPEDGSPDSGLKVSSVYNLELSNVDIRGFLNGIKTYNDGGPGYYYSIKNSTMSYCKIGLLLGNTTVFPDDIEIVNNTIAQNETGVLINTNENDLLIENNIIVSNINYGVKRQGAFNGRLIFNDVWGNGTNYYNVSAGQGSISADPDFVNAAFTDFHLSETSPCIDAGDPNSPNDPDGTRSDMGAFYFNQPGHGGGWPGDDGGCKPYCYEQGGDGG